MVLYPEGAIKLQGTGREVLERCDGQRTFVELSRIDHLVDDSEGIAFFGSETVAEQAELLGGTSANEPGKAHWT